MKWIYALEMYNYSSAVEERSHLYERLSFRSLELLKYLTPQRTAVPIIEEFTYCNTIVLTCFPWLLSLHLRSLQLPDCNTSVQDCEYYGNVAAEYHRVLLTA